MALWHCIRASTTSTLSLTRSLISLLTLLLTIVVMSNLLSASSCCPGNERHLKYLGDAYSQGRGPSFAMVHESRGSSQDVGGECSAEQMDVILGYLSQPSKRVLHRRSLRSLSHSSDVLERRFVDSRHDLQLGSRPPPCHSQCARCEDGVCIARPVYSRGSSGAAQHAIWTCSCLH